MELVSISAGGSGGRTFAAAQRLEGGLVPKSVLATLHDERQPVVDALMGLLASLVLRRSHRVFLN
jgi:hypothetical protein